MKRLVRTVGSYVALAAAVAALIVVWPARHNTQGRRRL